MKKTLLLAAVALVGTTQAQVFQSDFETWAGGHPAGWGGSKTNLPIAGVSEVTEGAHGGAKALRLTRTESGHQRYSTQTVALVAGTEYNVTFWLKGAGDVRVGLFDDRSTSSGYAYSPYATATSTWSEVTLSVTAVENYAAGEFILSVRSSVAPDHIMIDDLVIEEAGGLEEVSIYDIQYTTNANGDSPRNGEVVITGGIVTGTYLTYNNDQPQHRYTYIQSGSGPWNGIVIFDYANNNNEAVIGDSLVVTGTIEEFNGLTEIKDLQSFSVVSSGNTVPAPLLIETGDLSAEALESVLVQVRAAECTVVPSGATFGKWNVDDGSGESVIGKLIHTVVPAPVLGAVYNVTGVVSFTNFQNNPEYNIQPRVAADVEISTSVDHVAFASAKLFPNPANEVVVLDLGSEIVGRTSYTLIDASGRVIMADVLTSDRTDLRVNALQAGVYRVIVQNNVGVRSLPLQVVR